MSLNNSSRLTLTVEEARKQLGLSRGATYEAIRRGEIPSIRIGRRIIIPRVPLERMLGITGTEGLKSNGGASGADSECGAKGENTARRIKGRND